MKMKERMQRLRLNRSRRARLQRKPINILASVMTTLNLYCGLASIFASVGQEYGTAAKLILLGIIFDIADGFVARLTKSASEFGKELDSLADIVTFGVAPAVLVFVSYPLELPVHLPVKESIIGKTGSYMAIIYAICAALRLARFNTYQADRKDSFVGLPSPAAGGTIASFVLFLQVLEEKLQSMPYGSLAYYALGPMAVILAILMVSAVKYPKNQFRNLHWEPRPAFQLLGGLAFIIALAHYANTISPWIVLFPMGLTYVLYGLWETSFSRWTAFRTRSGQPLPQREAEQPPQP